jgi:hypothetical protein
LFDDAAAAAFGVAFPAVFFLLAAVGVIRTEAAFTLEVGRVHLDRLLRLLGGPLL